MRKKVSIKSLEEKANGGFRELDELQVEQIGFLREHLEGAMNCMNNLLMHQNYLQVISNRIQHEHDERLFEANCILQVANESILRVRGEIEVFVGVTVGRIKTN